MGVSAPHVNTCLAPASHGGDQAGKEGLGYGLPLFLENSPQFRQGDGGYAAVMDPALQLVPDVFDGRQIRRDRWPGQDVDLGFLQVVAHNEGAMCWGIVMLKNDSRPMFIHKWDHVLLDYFVPVPSTIEIALDEHKVSPVT